MMSSEFQTSEVGSLCF